MKRRKKKMPQSTLRDMKPNEPPKPQKPSRII